MILSGRKGKLGVMALSGMMGVTGVHKLGHSQLSQETLTEVCSRGER